MTIFRTIILFILCVASSIGTAQQGKDVKHINEVYKLPAAIYDVKGMGELEERQRLWPNTPSHHPFKSTRRGLFTMDKMEQKRA